MRTSPLPLYVCGIIDMKVVCAFSIFELKF
jgi:hypothetical protein